MYLIFKWYYLFFCADSVDEIVDEIDKCHRELKCDRTATEINAQQRYMFLVESTLGLCWHIGIAMFLILAMTQPVWTKNKLPFHCIHPFNWHDPERHPLAHIISYIWQCLVLTYNMISILYMELLSSHIFTQLGCNLKILCLEFQGLTKLSRNNEELFRRELYRSVEFHQRILSLVDRTNRVFYAPMIMQMIASFLMISLSTFVSLVARHEPSVAARFVIFMVLSFLHLSYWCIAGDMVTEHSQKVAHAAYEVYEWLPYKPEVQRDVMFVIQRAQLPLSMVASPFPPFNLFSYMSILKQCYTILTVLLESLD
ncbi:odorant receptor 47b-like [Drosophila innubila]|uniref:odorant receptor 47b-like n=1 Tax=Drosophila innubila TaxID=198719 RepID=UPI00148C0649|nr:odorant receptor 47b-like [Drosophila innubila]